MYLALGLTSASLYIVFRRMFSFSKLKARKVMLCQVLLVFFLAVGVFNIRDLKFRHCS